jgi:hypothetical protein
LPINRFNTGRDVAIDFVTPNGPRRFSNIVEFTKRQMNRRETSAGLDGVTRFQYIPGGWEGNISIDRFNRLVDDTIYEFEQIYLDGGNVPPCTINETIREPDGSLSSWRYEGVMFAMPDAGTANQNSKINQRLEWCASFRKRVSGGQGNAQTGAQVQFAPQ